MLALGLDYGQVTMVDETTGEVKWTVQALSEEFGTDPPSGVAMSPDGRFVASVGLHPEHWTLWDAATGALHMASARHDGTWGCICKGHPFLQEGCPVVAHTAGLHALAFSPCGQRLATGGRDSSVILWNAQTGKAEFRLQGHSRGVRSVCFSADGARLASGSLDLSICVWDAYSGGLLRAIPTAHKIFVMSLCFDPKESGILASASFDQIHVWDVVTGALKKSFEGHCYAVFSPDGRTIATASPNRERDVLLVDAETGAMRLRMVGYAKDFSSAAWSVDGTMIASGGSYDGVCKVWDSSTGALFRSTNVRSRICSVAWARDAVRDEKCAAFAMGQHPRLGAGSQVLGLDEELLRMILDRV